MDALVRASLEDDYQPYPRVGGSAIRGHSDRFLDFLAKFVVSVVSMGSKLPLIVASRRFDSPSSSSSGSAVAGSSSCPMFGLHRNSHGRRIASVRWHLGTFCPMFLRSGRAPKGPAGPHPQETFTMKFVLVLKCIITYEFKIF